ncbi:DUF6160 family protein [Acinetobacter venetianus]|uniref:DUF6160 family protein n=1 Tax=Acinetobacter venetianus TaxID=52133 RepID=UPI00037D947C|nr:DUF6160 family protein [Acinetobacter venetianus]
MNKNKIISCLCLLLSPAVMAMQPMDDQSLSVATGQDGLNINLSTPKIEFKQLAVIDPDGWDTKSAAAAEYRSRGALVLAQSPNSTLSNLSITAKSSGAVTNLNVNAAIDVDKGTGANGAFANIGLSFGNLDELDVSKFSVYTAGSNAVSDFDVTSAGVYTQRSIFGASTATLTTGVKELLRLSDGLNIKFLASNKPKMNIQLGAAPQSYMVRLGGAIDSICGTGTGCNMMLVSSYATESDPTTAPVGASFKFQMKASNSSTGFRLDNFHAGIESDGLVFGNYVDSCSTTPATCITSDSVDLRLNEVKFGNDMTTIPAVGSSNYRFNGLQNSPIGNIGFTNASVTDLKMKVSGL